MKIINSSSLSVCLVPPSLDEVNGYIIQYSGKDPQLINGDTYILEGLKQEIIYQFSVFAFIDLPSSESNAVIALFDGM